MNVVAAVIVQNGRVLLCRRPEGGQDGGRWEFPGGKVKRGETPQDALVRELMEELGLSVAPIRILYVVEIARPGGEALRLQFFLAAVTSGEPRPMERQTVRWVIPNDLSAYNLCEPDKLMAAELLDRKSEQFYRRLV